MSVSAEKGLDFFSHLDRWIDQFIEKTRPRNLPERILWWTTTAGVGYLIYWNYYGKKARRRRQDLEQKLAQVQIDMISSYSQGDNLLTLLMILSAGGEDRL
jgi:hypothetical protein